ncbi:hypothetical protein ACHQM5_022344 [Ranunculus cassubicifolius]
MKLSTFIPILFVLFFLLSCSNKVFAENSNEVMPQDVRGYHVPQCNSEECARFCKYSYGEKTRSKCTAPVTCSCFF